MRTGVGGWGSGVGRAAFRTAHPLTLALLVSAVAAPAGCREGYASPGPVLTFSGSALGAEGQVLTKQLQRFMKLHPEITVQVQPTPDDATQRHQLFVQWLNAQVGDPDVLQLDVVWTPEFAAAGWILPLDRFHPDVEAFFPSTIEANRWAGQLFALPWFVDVGLLYWRTDLVAHEPRTMDELVTFARSAMARPGGPRYGFVWQGARYEGLMTVFVEILGGFGGRIIDGEGRVVVDAPEGVRALTFMRDALTRNGLTPFDVLTWHEEETRFAFQNGNAVFMRNWPYAYQPMSDAARSRVAGKFATAPMPAAPGGRPTAALGGAPLAINARTEFPEAAFTLVTYLTAPEQMLERAAAVQQFPTRPAMYDDARLRSALSVPVEQVRRAIESATPRPVTPVYTELSDILQIELHRALAGQTSPADALHSAADRMNALLERTGVRRLMAGGCGPGGTPCASPDQGPAR
jgi:ABC-type glycerol-3-phosphate transport system substrate-binding protein